MGPRTASFYSSHRSAALSSRSRSSTRASVDDDRLQLRRSLIPDFHHGWIRAALLIVFLLSTSMSTLASPILETQSSQPSASSNSYMPYIPTIFPRDRYEISNASGTPSVIDPTTQSFVSQGAGTDGGGQGFDAPAIIWIIFSLAVGVPMAIAGMRGMRGSRVGRDSAKITVRLTTGVGVGLAVTIAAWAAIINTLSSSPISDLVLTLIVLCFFIISFIFGCLSYGRPAGIACLGLTGGLAFGIRIVILHSGLLVSGDGNYGGNWAIISLFGIAGGLAMIWGRSQRWSLLVGCASIGSFLTCLGIDLIISKQAGMSRGLRFLFDRNGAHYLDIFGGGYTPPSTTQILIGLSLAATPALAVMQRYFFRRDFVDKNDDSDSSLDSEADSELKTERISPMVPPKYPRTKPTALSMSQKTIQGNAAVGVPVGSVYRFERTIVNQNPRPRKTLNV